MYVRVTRAKTRQGPVEYVQLCHNRRDPRTGQSRTEVLYSFGRADCLDVDAIRRLIGSLARLLPPEESESVQQRVGAEWPLEFLGSRPLGGTWFLQGMWQRLGIDQTLLQVLDRRAYQTPVERMIFAMVANRALAPASKLYLEHWVAEEVYVPGLPEVEVHQLYRAMDFLLEASEEVQREVFFCVADLFNLDVDLLFLDTTSTYFEIECEDADQVAYDKDGKEELLEGLRKRSQNSKDHRPDLPQVVVAFAVTRGGIPVRCWVWPGNRVDQDVVEEVKRDLNGWRLGRVVMVEDAGFNSAENRRVLQGAGGHYIIGERMRQGPEGEPVPALQRGGKFKKLASGLEVKDVVVGGDSEARRRFVVVRNPVQVERDRKKRADIVAEVENRLAELKQLDGKPHAKAACELRSHPVFGRYVRQTKTGKLRLNQAKIKGEAQFDGKFLISTSDDGLSAEDVVLGYKQLFEIERVFRDLKHLIDIRPVRHRLPDRIRAHVVLCWLGMLMIRVAETQTNQTWFQIKKLFSTLQVGVHRTSAGEVWQTSTIRAELCELLDALKIKRPLRYLRLPGPKSKRA